MTWGTALVRRGVLLLPLLVGLWPLGAGAASVSMSWTSGGTGAYTFQVQRCAVSAGQAECTPTTDLAGAAVASSVTTFTDTTVAAGQSYCWTVFAVGPGGARAQVRPGADGKRYVCKQAEAGTLPWAGPIVLTPQGSSLLVRWSLPTFTATTVPASALTGFAVWRRAEPNPTGASWVAVKSLGASVLQWEDTAPARPGSCYQIRAQYGTLGYVDNGTVCADAPTAPTPLPLPTPTNLRFAP